MLLPPPAKPKIKKGARRSRSASIFETDQDAADHIDGGIWPAEDLQMAIDDWEDKTGHALGPDDVDQVAKLVTWCFVKWDDLQYDQCELLGSVLEQEPDDQLLGTHRPLVTRPFTPPLSVRWGDTSPPGRSRFRYSRQPNVSSGKQRQQSLASHPTSSQTASSEVYVPPCATSVGLRAD